MAILPAGTLNPPLPYASISSIFRGQVACQSCGNGYPDTVNYFEAGFCKLHNNCAARLAHLAKQPKADPKKKRKRKNPNGPKPYVYKPMP